ncbi:hypothetical protein BX616_008640, partial [Lobosporangium transversale]
MKAISATICLFAVACLTAHAIPQQEGETYYAAALQREWDQEADTVSELEYRRIFLLKESEMQVAEDTSAANGPDTAANVAASSVKCDNGLEQLKNVARKLPDQLAKDLNKLTGSSLLAGALKVALAPVAAAAAGFNELTAFVVSGIFKAIDAIKAALKPFEDVIGFRVIIKAMKKALMALEKLVEMVTGCKRNGGKSGGKKGSKPMAEAGLEAMDGSQCNVIAEIYRGL